MKMVLRGVFHYLLIFTNVIFLVNSRRLCDVRIWYLNIIGDDVFNIDLNKEQLALKYSIEQLVLNAAESKEKRMIDCTVLTMYDDMLKEQFDYVASGSGMAMKEIDSNDVKTSPPNEPDSHSNSKLDKSKQDTKHLDNDEQKDDVLTDEYNWLPTKEIKETGDEENAEKKDEEEAEEKGQKQKLHMADVLGMSEEKDENDQKEYTKDKHRIDGKDIDEETISEQENTDAADIENIRENEAGEIDDGAETSENSRSQRFKSDERIVYVKYDEPDNQESDSDEIIELNSGAGSETSEEDNTDDNSLPEDIDETEILDESDLEEESQDTIESDLEEKSQGTTVSLSTDNENLPQSRDDDIEKVENDEVRQLKETTIPLGICWSFGCVASDIFYIHVKGAISNSNEFQSVVEAQFNQTQNTKNIHSKKEISAVSSKKNKTQICNLDSSCSLVCFYFVFITNNVCVQHYSFDLHTNNPFDKLVSQNLDDKGTVSGKDEAEKYDALKQYGVDTTIDHDNKNIETETTHLNKPALTKSDETSTYGEKNNEDKPDGAAHSSNRNGDNINKDTKTDSNTKEDLNPNIDLETDELYDIYTESEDESASGEIFESNTDTKSESDLNLQQETNKGEMHKEFHNAKDRSSGALSVSEFEHIVEKKALQYFAKIQTLEMMIMKLENQLLTEALNKQNHSSTITKLENHILKLENEMLKISKSYEHLREEADNIRNRQNKYLELAYKQQAKQQEYLELPDHSTKNFELISQHQAKLNELASILRNQSNTIMFMKEKQNILEEQNMMLHQMVMNQSIFMTSIIKTVQDLSEQNMRNHREIETLRMKLESNILQQEITKEKSQKRPIRSDTDVIEQLDSLLFDNKKQKEHLPQQLIKDRDKESGHNLPLNGQLIFQWCPKDNQTCPTCYYDTVIKSNCAPFSNVIWSKCNNLKNDKVKRSEIDLPIVPEVADNAEDKNINVQETLETAAKKNSEESQSLNIQNEDKLEGLVNEKNRESEQAPIDEENRPIGIEHLVDIEAEYFKEQKQDHVDKSSDEREDINKEIDDNEYYKYKVVGYDKQGKPVLKLREEYTENLEGNDENNRNKDLKQTTSESEKEVLSQNDAKKTTSDDKSEQIGKANNEKTDEQIPDEEDVNSGKNMAESKNQEIIESNEMKKKVADSENKKKTETEKDKTIANVKQSNKETIKSPSNVQSKETVDRGEKLTNEKKDDKIEKEDVKSKDVGDKEEKVTKENKDDKIVKTDVKSKETTIKPIKGDEKVKEPNKIKPDEEKSKTDAKQKSEKRDEKGEEKPKEKKPKSEKIDEKEEEKQKEKIVPINLRKGSQSEPKDCYDLYNRGSRNDGMFKIKPVGSDNMIEVFCDMRRGGWTVIQRRQDGTTNFFQTWDDYKKGFGGVYGEHWLGNDNIHLLTNQDYYKLRVDLMDWDKKKKYAEFDWFLVESEDEGYMLHIEGYSGDAGDGLTKHDGNKFSTKDVDNDKVVKEFGGSCANRFYGAGWYYKCYASNLNGRFYKGGTIPEKRFDGITWKPWTGPNYSLKKVEMKIKPASAK